MIPTGRREFVLISLHTVLAAIWALGALWNVRSVSRFEAGLLALGLNLLFALALGWWDDRLAASRTPEDREWDRSVSLVLIVVASAFLFVTVLTGAVHDYALYEDFWFVVQLGRDPWFVQPGVWGVHPPNAYGPLFNLLAGVMSVNLLAPKLLFAATYIAAATALTKTMATRRQTSRFVVLLVWAWNPYVWVEVAIRGHFDVMVGAASVAAVHARRRGQDLPCAIALALGILLKYIPITLLPFLALERGRVRGRLVVAMTVPIALGIGLSYLVWGPSMFGPLSFAATRHSTYLSIFRFLRGRYSPLDELGLEVAPDQLALPALALALLGVWWWCRTRQPDPATAAVLAMLVTLLLYRNGYPQYQMVLLMLASYCVAQTWEQRRHRTALAITLVGYFGWIVVFDVTYSLIGEGVPTFEDLVGLPTFALGCALGACIVWSEPQRSCG